MNKRVTSPGFIAGLASLAIAPTACSGGTLAAPADSGAIDSGAVDTGTTQMDAGQDAPAPEDASPPTDAAAKDAGQGLTALASGTEVVLWGVTGDGYVIYSAGSSSSYAYYAVPLSGGAAVQIAQAANDNSIYATIQQNLVFIETNPDANYVSPVTIWSHAGGAHQVSTASTYMMGASSDSSHFAYFDHVVETASDAGLALTADLYGANADGSGATLLQSGVRGFNVTGASSCGTYLTFQNTYAILSECTASQTLTVSTYASATTWSAAQVAAGATSLSAFDNAGTMLLYSSSAGLQWVPLGGGTPTTIDATGTSGTFTNDGKSVLYVTTAGALARSPVSSPSPQQLVASGVEGVWSIAPDDKTALIFDNINQQNGLSDLYLASTTIPGTPATLVSGQTAVVAGTVGYMYGSPFTTDSSHALYWSNVVVPTGSQYFTVLGDFESSATSGPATPVQLGGGSNQAIALADAKVAFVSNLASLGNNAPTFDIEWVDTSTSAMPQKLASGAIYAGSSPFLTTPAKDRFVYVSAEPADAGAASDAGPMTVVYTAPVP